MHNKHYKYDPETLSYKEIKKGIKYYAKRAVFHISFGVVVSIGLFFIYMNLFDSPKEKRLKREQHELLAQYEQMSRRLGQIEEVLDDIHSRDENIYRVIYEADSIPVSVRKAGFGGINRYKDMESLPNSKLVIETAKKLDIVSRQLYVQSKKREEEEEKGRKKGGGEAQKEGTETTKTGQERPPAGDGAYTRCTRSRNSMRAWTSPPPLAQRSTPPATARCLWWRRVTPVTASTSR